MGFVILRNLVAHVHKLFNFDLELIRGVERCYAPMLSFTPMESQLLIKSSVGHEEIDEFLQLARPALVAEGLRTTIDTELVDLTSTPLFEEKHLAHCFNVSLLDAFAKGALMQWRHLAPHVMVIVVKSSDKLLGAIAAILSKNIIEYYQGRHLTPDNKRLIIIYGPDGQPIKEISITGLSATVTEHDHTKP